MPIYHLRYKGKPTHNAAEASPNSPEPLGCPNTARKENLALDMDQHPDPHSQNVPKGVKITRSIEDAKERKKTSKPQHIPLLSPHGQSSIQPSAKSGPTEQPHASTVSTNLQHDRATSLPSTAHAHQSHRGTPTLNGYG